MSTLANTALLRAGYSMADLDRLATIAARRHGGAADMADKYDTAWHGIAELLYASETDPTESELLFAAVRALQEFAAENRREHGRSHRHGYEYGSAPRFATYWNERVVTPDHAEPTAERLGLPQALATLTGEQYDAIAAVAALDSLAAAADALGITYAQLLRRFYAAREQVRVVWFEHETPRTTKATEDACGSGHAKSEHQRTGPTGHTYCKECQRLAKRRRRANGVAA